MDKYFTPSIEDIRVGYECEIKQRGLGFLDWTPYTIHSKYAFYHYFDDSGSASIRVPYLTKEQIEDEGWEVSNKGCFVDRCVFIRGNYFMVLDTSRDVPFVDFYLRDPSLEEGVPNPERFRFFCECKDINTFRYLCKLLNTEPEGIRRQVPY